MRVYRVAGAHLRAFRGHGQEKKRTQHWNAKDGDTLCRAFGWWRIPAHTCAGRYVDVTCKTCRRIIAACVKRGEKPHPEKPHKGLPYIGSAIGNSDTYERNRRRRELAKEKRSKILDLRVRIADEAIRWEANGSALTPRGVRALLKVLDELRILTVGVNP